MYKLFLVLLGISLFIGCGDASDSSNERPQGSVSLSTKVSQVSPKGAHIFSEHGVSDSQLSLADKGLDTTFTNARASGYTSNELFSQTYYDIYIPKNNCVLSPETKTPSFKIRGDNYDGSIYDQYNTKGELPPNEQTDFNKYVKDGIGVVYAAEMVLGTAGRGAYVVCPDAAVWENGVSYGAEHIIVNNLDPAYDQVTQTHDIYPHPILPKRGAVKTTKPSVIPKGDYIIRAVR